ncbi:alpha/beta hydrolase [Edaphobacter modestus]|uniref:Serine aminopeptidase S33 domain-containing protein n=1 Tax=Edaphobacter modestus TaxID=388466 RepID=A0A4Q7YQW3_9BACT|nr:alpha/beta hydrolase [Edaphobacter modestus]RZU39554.1 hypothetical protein BDD14_0939 [Edaphobacter modestus]
MPHSASKPKQKRQRAETVEVAWLLKALAAIFVAAAVCTYLTLCFLFYRAQWQVVLHPVRTSVQELAQSSLIHFAPGDSGQPQLTGKWLAADVDSRYGGLTILFLSAGDRTEAAFAETQTALQRAGLNVFAFDYRGYGQSANVHPDQRRMTEDSEAAWNYLTNTRKIRGEAIIPYGVGVGASLATSLAMTHAEIPGIILDSPYADLDEVVGQDPRFRLLPTSLLFHEDFPLTEPLSRLQKPKLLIARDHGTTATAFRTAAEPKITVSLDASSDGLFHEAVTRFLDQYGVVPSAAPGETKLR